MTRLRVTFLAVVTAFALLPAGAEAKPGYKVRPGGTELDISLGEKAGYGFAISAEKARGVRLLVEEELFSATEYSTQGRISSKRIEADLGDLGRVDVKVRLITGQSERGRKGNRRCKGRPPLYLRGEYHGRIEFSGEGDVPPISSKRGRVLFTRSFRQVCKRPSQGKKGDGKQGSGKGSSVEIGGLTARAKGGGRTTLFEAFTVAPARNPKLSLGFALGAAYERRGEVRIARTAIEIFSLGIVMSKRGKDPETVKVKMENPFVGRGLYSRSLGSPATWTGDLRAKLPGADPVPLTGPDFSAAFCRGSSFERIERCLYGSGSHSQPLALAKLSSLR